MRRSVALIVACMLVVATGWGLAVAQSSKQAAGKTDPTLNKLSKEWVAAFNAKDAARVAALYTDDAALNPPNESAVRGRTSIEAWVKKSMESFSAFTLTPTESAISGDLGYEAGTFSVVATSPGGAKMTERGKYVVVLERVGGKWLVAHDIFNSDSPPPPAAPKSE